VAVTKIGTAMIEVLAREGLNGVMWGDANLLDTAYQEAGAKAKVSYLHPLDRWHRVLGALDRDDRFKKGYIRIDVHQSGGRTVRVFHLKTA